MALIAGYGGTVTFSGTSAVACRSVTMNFERDSLDVTQIGDYRMKRAAGRVRRSGSLTLYRQNGSVDDALRTHVDPGSLVNATGATLNFAYTDQGSKAYTSIAIQVTSAVISDDGTGAGTWEITWEEQ
jgi:hypothetical protein